LILSYEQAKKEVAKSIIEVGNAISKALDELGEKKWKKWLKDSRVQLNQTQAYKFIAVSKFFQNNLQLTECIKSTGIEKAYLLTKIEDEKIREEFAGKIIDAEFTVFQTRQVISKINDESKSPVEAIKEVKSIPKLPVDKPDRKTVSIEEFNKLQADYDKLLNEKQELEEKLSSMQKISKDKEAPKENEAEILKEPVDSDAPDFTIDEKLHAVVFKGKKIPISRNLKLTGKDNNYLEIIAIREAKEKFEIDLS